MSTLRLIGFFCGLIVLLITFYRLRFPAEKRTNIWLLIGFAVILMLVSLFPGVVNLPADLISLGDQKGGRLITLLLISSALLWFFILYERGKNDARYFQFDQWARNTTVKEFLESYPKDFEEGTIFILIPAYNEAENLEQVLPKIPRRINEKPVNRLIIDDGSTDATCRVAQKHDAMVAVQRSNRGGGAALKVGYEIIRKISPAVVVTMDADGQHAPEAIQSLVEPILENEADFIIGSRIIGTHEIDSSLRFHGVRVFSKMINILLGTHITDCSSGFRAFNKTILDDCLLLEEQYHTAELIIEAAKKGYRIEERPIHIAKRLSGKSKKGKDFKYALFFFRTILKSWFR